MASNLSGCVRVEYVSPGVYKAEPFGTDATQGNRLPIAYGGFATSQCISAGQATVPETNPPFHLYSAQGTFLGPASTQIKTTFQVTEIRNTRTFCSRQVLASQLVPNPKTGEAEKRNVMMVLMDWHVQESQTLFDYSIPTMYPAESYSQPDKLLTIRESVVKDLKPDAAKYYNTAFRLFQTLFDIRPCTSSMAGQNHYGYSGRDIQTSQDGVEITKRTNSSWFRSLETLQGQRDTTASLA